MRSKEHYLSNLWKWKCGIKEDEEVSKDTVNFEEYKVTEWSPEFENLMRNRLIMGAIRYGRMGHGSKPDGKPNYDRIESIRKRLEFFEKTGNAEWLIDIGNMALLMFEEKQHPNFHFKSIDDGYHDKIIG